MRRSKQRKREASWNSGPAGYLFAAPAVIFFTAFVGLPIIINVAVLSFADFSLLGDFKWVGLKNFRDLFADPATKTILLNTLKLFAVLVPVHIY